jgi:hypothetical protein
MMQGKGFCGIQCVAILVAVLSAAPTLADVTGSIRGTVTDSTGAVVPGAAVTLFNPNTGLRRQASTSSEGEYQFLEVPVGEGYQIQVGAAGFGNSERASITLLVNQTYRADFQLQVGQQTAKVTVMANPMQVETTNTQLGDVVGSKMMTDLPLDGRSFTDLLGLQPGVAPEISPGASFTTNFFNVSPSGVLNGGQLSVNGGREASNQYVVNGSDVEESFSNGTSVVPNLDSIQEFRILTNTFDAEYGRFSGAIVNVLTKSGTNSYHGNIFEFVRNNALDAHDYTDLPGTTKRNFKRNQFGGTFGGPILKNRLFFFSDYQGWRESRGVQQITDVPSAAEYNGDFSQAAAYTGTNLVGFVVGNQTPVPGAVGMDQVLSQRLGYAVTSGEPYWTPGCNSLADSQAGMCVFYGQQIPTKAWDPVASAIVQKNYFVPANGTDPYTGYPAWISNSFNNTLQDDKFGQRIDLNTGAWGNWSFYYFFDQTTQVFPFYNASVPGFPASVPNRSQNLSVRNTRNFGSSAVNEVAAGFTRFGTLGATPTTGLGPLSSFGFQQGGLGIVPEVPKWEGLPLLQLGRGETIGAPNTADAQFDNTFSASDNFSKITGKHSLKLGGEYRNLGVHWRLNEVFNGGFTFGGSETKNDFADFLIGAPSGFHQNAPALMDSQSFYWGVYAQDSYQLRRNLTLNYGLRWEAFAPWADQQNRLYTFRFGTQSMIYPDAPEGYVFPGDPGIPRGLSPNKWNKFAPRFGLAYSPSASGGFLGKILGSPGKSSIRAGAGIFYDAFGEVVNDWEMGNPPFGLYYISNVPVYTAEPYAARTGPNPGQRFPLSVPTPGTTGIWAPYLPICCITGWAPDNTVPYTEQYNINVQRQVGTASVVTLAYVGTRGHHLVTQRDINPADPAKCMAVDAALGGRCSGVIYNSNGVVTARGSNGALGPDQIYDLGNGTVYDGLRRHSVTSGRLLGQGLLDFGEVGETATAANSSYNALQASLQTRMKSLQMLASYVWSQSLDDSSGFLDGAEPGPGTFLFTWQNPINPELSKGLSSFNITHNFVVSYNYELPFTRLAPSRNRVARGLLGGWELSGITRFSTGFPVYMDASLIGYDPSLCFCAYTATPDYDGASIRRMNPRTNDFQYFDTSPFSVPNLLSFGTARHRFFSGPGIDNWDMALHRLIKLRESTSLEFRAEFFNTFNHVQFTGVNGSLPNPVLDSFNPIFGKVTGERDMRIGQVALKLSF